jgi:hypothetical protein
MQQLRNRITYANVMSTIAVFLVLGGATAFAAAKLGKNSVGTKQLKASSVTAAKLKKNSVSEKKVRNGAISTSKIKDGAIATAKIRDGAVTGVKVQTATLGTVPNAATFSGYSRKAIRVAASPPGASFDASRAASPEIPLVSAGAFTLYAKCFDDGEFVNGNTYVKTTESGSIFQSALAFLDGDPNFLNVNTPEEDRLVQSEIARTDVAHYFGANEFEFSAMAPSGTVVLGTTQVGVKRGNLPGGNGIYGAGNVCLFAAEMTALNG